MRFGQQILLQQMESMREGPWAQYSQVFRVVMHNMWQENSSSEIESSLTTKESLDKLLQDLSNDFAKTYIHLYQRVDVYINSSETLLLKYWETRLVNLASFPLSIEPQVLSTKEATTTPNAKSMMLYCGFDAWRQEDRKVMQLYIYSRPSGRLVQSHMDARNILSLTSGGTDFCQSFVAILDDREGHLPLTPTKQALAFGEQGGHIMEQNVYAWISAYCRYYYMSYKKSMNNSKENLTKYIKAVTELPRIDVARLTIVPLQKGDWDHLLPNSMNWKRAFDKIIATKVSVDMLVRGRDSFLRMRGSVIDILAVPAEKTMTTRKRAICHKSATSTKDDTYAEKNGVDEIAVDDSSDDDGTSAASASVSGSKRSRLSLTTPSRLPIIPLDSLANFSSMQPFVPSKSLTQPATATKGKVHGSFVKTIKSKNSPQSVEELQDEVKRLKAALKSSNSRATKKEEEQRENELDELRLENARLKTSLRRESRQSGDDLNSQIIRTLQYNCTQQNEIISNLSQQTEALRRELQEMKSRQDKMDAIGHPFMNK
jgi:hypothetical protein